MNVNIKQKKKLKHRQKEYKKSLKFNKVKKRGHSKKRKAFQLSVLLNILPIIFFIMINCKNKCNIYSNSSSRASQAVL